MKQISARQFRVNFPKLAEPVQVTLYKDGEYRVIGTWSPYVPTIEDAIAAIRPPAPFKETVRTIGQVERDAILRRVNRNSSER